MPAPSENVGRAISWGSLLVAIIVGFALGGLCLHFFGQYLVKPTADSPAAHDGSEPEKADEKVVRALGRIEPMDGVLSLGVAAPDRILEILVEEGKEVQFGKELVKLEGKTLLDLEEKSIDIQRQEAKKRLKAILGSGKAQIQVEEARLKQAKELNPLELDSQQSRVALLSVQAENAKKDYRRLEKIGDTIAEQDKEKQKLLWLQADQEVSAAKKQLKKLEREQPLNVEMVEARRTAAQAEMERGASTISLEELDNKAKQVEARREAARMTAPSDGTILRLLAHKGELVSGKPIVQMANLKKMIVVAEVPTTSVPRIHEGDPAIITSPVFDRLKVKLEGEVYSIRAIVGKPQVTSPDPLANVDYRIMEVKILLKQSKPANGYIGHEVSVEIEPR